MAIIMMVVVETDGHTDERTDRSTNRQIDSTGVTSFMILDFSVNNISLFLCLMFFFISFYFFLHLCLSIFST